MHLLIKSSSLLVSVLLSISFSSGIELRLKLSGGFDYSRLGKVNASLASWDEKTRKEILLNSAWSVEEGKVPKLNAGYNFEGEATVRLNRNISIGIGAGYIYAELTEEETSLRINKETETYLHARPTKISAHPLTLTASYFFRLMENMDIYVKGGMGILAAKYIDREAQKKTSDARYVYPVHQTASARDKIILGGIGLSLDLEDNLGFFVELLGRLAKVSGFEGEDKAGVKGSLFSFDEYNPGLAIWEKKVQILAQEPEGENYSSVQKAVVDFSGFSAKIGIFFKF